MIFKNILVFGVTFENMIDCCFYLNKGACMKFQNTVCTMILVFCAYNLKASLIKPELKKILSIIQSFRDPLKRDSTILYTKSFKEQSMKNMIASIKKLEKKQCAHFISSDIASLASSSDDELHRLYDEIVKKH